jgi:hypothetical protein
LYHNPPESRTKESGSKQNNPLVQFLKQHGLLAQYIILALDIATNKAGMVPRPAASDELIQFLRPLQENQPSGAKDTIFSTYSTAEDVQKAMFFFDVQETLTVPLENGPGTRTTRLNIIDYVRECGMLRDVFMAAWKAGKVIELEHESITSEKSVQEWVEDMKSVGWDLICCPICAPSPEYGLKPATTNYFTHFRCGHACCNKDLQRQKEVHAEKVRQHDMQRRESHERPKLRCSLCMAPIIEIPPAQICKEVPEPVALPPVYTGAQDVYTRPPIHFPRNQRGSFSLVDWFANCQCFGFWRNNHWQQTLKNIQTIF